MTTFQFGGSQILREVARLYIRQQRESVACCDGTTLTECLIVTDLGRAGRRTLTELTTVIGFDKSWTSRAIDRLAAEGIVSKKQDASDGRRVQLALTAKGRRKFERVNQALGAHASEVLEHVPFEKRKAVLDALALVHDALLAHAAEQRKEVRCAG